MRDLIIKVMFCDILENDTVKRVYESYANTIALNIVFQIASVT